MPKTNGIVLIAEQLDNMSACKECGFNNREGNKFCVNCGCALHLSKEYIQKQKDDKTKMIVIIVIGFILSFLIYYGITVSTQQEAEKEFDRISHDSERQTEKDMRDAQSQVDRMMRDIPRNP